jgi:hypothetical protein
MPIAIATAPKPINTQPHHGTPPFEWGALVDAGATLTLVVLLLIVLVAVVVLVTVGAVLVSVVVTVVVCGGLVVVVVAVLVVVVVTVAAVVAVSVPVVPLASTVVAPASRVALASRWSWACDAAAEAALDIDAAPPEPHAPTRQPAVNPATDTMTSQSDGLRPAATSARLAGRAARRPITAPGSHPWTGRTRRHACIGRGGVHPSRSAPGKRSALVAAAIDQQ